jgi:hypothetical protein
MHIRIRWIAIFCSAPRLPPTQMKVVPSCQSKTPVAQMHFATELPLPERNHKTEWLINDHPSKSGRP